MPRIAIVICTYERPSLLARALDSILALDGLEAGEVEVVVVDNSDGGSGRAVVAAMAARAPVPVACVAAHPPNISVARNAGVAATQAEVVAFLDDDQEVERGWLAAVRDGLARFPHDVFFGPIAPRFEDEAGAGAPARTLFTRAGSFAAGADLMAYDRPPGQAFVLSTANSIVRRATGLAGEAPFDPGFGQCGGEDFYLFCRLQRAGRRFGWLPDARASDFVPRHRTAMPYLLRRHYAGGQAFAAALIRTSPHPRRACALIWAKAALQLLATPFAALDTLRRGGEARATLVLRVAGTTGKLLWPSLYPLYRTEARRDPDAG